MRIEFTPDPELFPFQSRFYDSSVGRVHYIDEGAGIPILLLHGNPTWSFLYRKIIPRLQDAFRCIAVDYPGFGLSDRPGGYGYTPDEHAHVIGQLVNHLDLDGFLLMIQDWGGPIGFDIATKRADRVRGIVYGNTWFWPVDTLTRRRRGMRTLIGSLTLREALVREVPAIGTSLVIAEGFYKFHSFTLECLAFMATWYAVELLGESLGRARRGLSRGGGSDGRLQENAGSIGAEGSVG